MSNVLIIRTFTFPPFFSLPLSAYHELYHQRKCFKARICSINNSSCFNQISKKNKNKTIDGNVHGNNGVRVSNNKKWENRVQPWRIHTHGKHKIFYHVTEIKNKKSQNRHTLMGQSIFDGGWKSPPMAEYGATHDSCDKPRTQWSIIISHLNGQ